MKTPDLAVEIAVSNMSFYPFDRQGHPSWGSSLEEILPFLEQTGYRNLEVHPTDAILDDALRDPTLANKAIGSLHETFNNGRGIYGYLGDMLGVQRSLGSFAGLQALQGALARPVPCVRYARPYGTVPTPDSFTVVQPTAEVYGDFNVSTHQQLMGLVAVQGFAGLCPDTFYEMDDWEGQFASGQAFQMHVGIDRHPGWRGREEHAAFTSARWQDAQATYTGDMITAAIDNWVVPAEQRRAYGRNVVRLVVERQPRIKTWGNRAHQHAQLVYNLAEIIREAGATPLLWNDASK